MAKIIWKPGNMVYPIPAVLVTVADHQGNENVLTIAWTGTVSSEPAMAYISVRPSRYSYHMLKDSGEFVINLTTKALAYATDYCGVKSGKDENKFEKAHLSKEEAKFVKAPLIKESPVNIECKVTQVIPCGSHDMFLGEVLCVHADEQYLDDTGAFALDKAQPLVYSHGKYYNMGERLGKFGYSVQKKK